jgi:hypothetical protein
MASGFGFPPLRLSGYKGQARLEEKGLRTEKKTKRYKSQFVVKRSEFAIPK